MGYYLKEIFHVPQRPRKHLVPQPPRGPRFPRRTRSDTTTYELSETSVAMSLARETVPPYAAHVPRAIIEPWFGEPERTFTGVERAVVGGAVVAASSARLSFFRTSFADGLVFATLSLTPLRLGGGVERRPETRMVMTGEIIDNRKHYLRTDRWGLRWADDEYYWAKFPPFDALPPAVRVGGGRTVCLADRRHLFLRFKVVSSSEFGLPRERIPQDRNLYYCCMDRASGHIVASHFDPARNPKILDLHPDVDIVGPPPSARRWAASDPRRAAAPSPNDPPSPPRRIRPSSLPAPPPPREHRALRRERAAGRRPGTLGAGAPRRARGAAELAE